MSNFFEKQIREKEKSKWPEIEEDLKQAEWFKNDTDKFNKEEYKKLVEKRKRNIENAQFVKRQMEEIIEPFDM